MADARAELVAAFARVLDSGRYVLGREVDAFEEEWAAFCDTRHAVGVSSGTDALALALRACGVEPGDEVLVPAMTALATWMAVAQIGAVPVGVDVGPGGGMDAERAAAAASPRTRALVAVHLFGDTGDVAGLARVAADAGVALIEDAAQAHGAAGVGKYGRAAAFSFYPTKNLGAIGDAGAVATDDPEIADRVRLLREYGWRTREDTEVEGVNARLDELQAAFLRVLLRRLPAALARRREIASAYLAGLDGAPGLRAPAPADGCAWHLFVVHHPERDRIAAAVGADGIGTAVHYAPPPPLTTTFGGRPGAFPAAEEHARTALSLPLHPALSDEDVARVVAAVRSATG